MSSNLVPLTIKQVYRKRTSDFDDPGWDVTHNGVTRNFNTATLWVQYFKTGVFPTLEEVIREWVESRTSRTESTQEENAQGA